MLCSTLNFFFLVFGLLLIICFNSVSSFAFFGHCLKLHFSRLHDLYTVALKLLNTTSRYKQVHKSAGHQSESLVSTYPCLSLMDSSSTDSNHSVFFSCHSTRNQEELMQDEVNNLMNQMKDDSLSFYGSAPEELWCYVALAVDMVEDRQLENAADDIMGSLESMNIIDPSDLEVGEEIAGGGQAHVFLAVWNRDHERVPVPVVAKRLKGVLSDVGQSKALRRQLQRVVGIGGSCLCEVLGVCEKDNAIYVVMERMLGDLRNFMDRTRVPFKHPWSYLEFKLYMIWCISSGMHELHMRGLLHRDLKASNVLFWSMNEMQKVASLEVVPIASDWDIEKTTLQDLHTMFFPFSIKVGDYESSEGVVGTGFWRAPEVLQQLNNGVTPVMLTDKADVYSYAMLCYEILTGCIPFADRYDLILQRQRICSKVISGERPEFLANLSEGLRRLLESCWHADPQQRPNFEQIMDVLGCEFKDSWRKGPGIRILDEMIFLEKRERFKRQYGKPFKCTYLGVKIGETSLIQKRWKKIAHHLW